MALQRRVVVALTVGLIVALLGTALLWRVSITLSTDIEAASLAACKHQNRVRDDTENVKRSVLTLARVMTNLRLLVVRGNPPPAVVVELQDELRTLQKEIPSLRQPIARFSCEKQFHG